MDAFYAAIEQRDNPALRGKPIAVGGSERRGVVATASYEARKFGVYSAMPSLTAKRKCPSLVFVPSRAAVYREVSKQIREIFFEYTDLVEPLSLDEAFLDVTSNEKQIPSATLLARELKERIRKETKLTASAGVSINKFLAKIASDFQKPNGLTVVPPEKAVPFIEALPIEKFYGVGKVTAKKMHKLSVYNGADLRQWTKEKLIRHFGKSGNYYFDIAHVQDERPVNPARIRKSLGAERTFRSDLVADQDIYTSLKGITEEVMRRMEKANITGKTVTVKIKFSDFRQITRSITVDKVVNSFDKLWELAQTLLLKVDLDTKQIRLLGITLSNFDTGEISTSEQLEMEF